MQAADNKQNKGLKVKIQRVRIAYPAIVKLTDCKLQVLACSLKLVYLFSSVLIRKK